MPKTLLKENIKEIKITFKRFLSIVLIVLLGVGFFAGIKATSPDMQNTVDTYFDQLEVMDFQILSTLGITKEDIQQIEQVVGVKEVCPSYSSDAIITVAEEDYVVKILSMTEGMNRLQVLEGRLPEKETECVVEETFLSTTDKKIGDSIEIKVEPVENEEGETQDFLKQNTMTIVGTVQSPLYISRERGDSKLGAGKVQFYFYLPEEAISSPVYTQCYVTVEGAKEISAFSEKYEDKINVTKAQLEEVAKVRQEERYQEVTKKANDKLQEAEDTLEEEKQKAQDSIREAEEKLEQGEKELEQGKKDIAINRTKANQEFAKADKQIQQAEKELTEKEELYNTGKKQAEEQFKQALEALGQMQTALQQAKEGLTALQTSRQEANSNKKSLLEKTKLLEDQIAKETQEDKKQILKEQLNQTNQAIKQLEITISTLDKKEIETKGTITTLNEKIQEVQMQIEEGTKEVTQNGKLLEQGKAQLQIQKTQLQKQKNITYQQLKQAEVKITSAEKEIQEGNETLAQEKQKAKDEIEKAEKELQEAKDKVKEIKKPQWYILDREMNQGFASFKQDTQRIANIGKVFPLVFFIVAALISLTSMTRMVEEQRGEIGTLKAMGYHKGQIMRKYLLYASCATILGGILGMLIGFTFLPKVIFNMYQMMYTVPDIIIEFNKQYAIVGLGIALLCTCGATLFSCIKELDCTPAELMRPKAPKPGKRVLLERINFIWSRLKFTQKVTVRNIFRYKKRFLMTIIGICGCTALIVAGFALRDAISNMIPMQYNKIFQYDMQITLKTDLTREELAKKAEEIIGQEKIKEGANFAMEAAKVNGSSQSVQLIIPEKKELIEEYITLKPRMKEKVTYELKEEGVIITEKLAKLLHVKKGDTIELQNTDDVLKQVQVKEITENYLGHYVYMSKEAYQKVFEEEPKYNVVLAKTQEMSAEEEDSFTKTILEQDNISSVSVTSRVKSIFDEVMDNMSFVVWVLIISAGLLAFVVLYNLSNVNISERIRELATIKVLGFYDKEVYKYVSRETILLTLIGTGFGLLMGYFLNMFILDTCELDMMMFARNVSAINYVYGIVITIFFATIVNIVTYFSLKKINMIDSLKSVE